MKTKAGHRAAAAATGGTSNLTHRRGTFIGLWWSRRLFDAQAWRFATREAVAKQSGNGRGPPVTPQEEHFDAQAWRFDRIWVIAEAV